MNFFLNEPVGQIIRILSLAFGMKLRDIEELREEDIEIYLSLAKVFAETQVKEPSKWDFEWRE